MKKENLTVLEVYNNVVFKALIIAIPSIALCAGATFSVLHLLGYYPDVKPSSIIIFDISCAAYTVLGIFLSRNFVGEDGTIKPGILKLGKIFIIVLMCVQWNFISYMIPSRDFWAYSFFFVLLSALFLDSRYVLIAIIEISISMFISWIVLPEYLLPVKDNLFIPEMTLRIVLIILCFSTIWLLTKLVEQRLARELEKISDFDTLTLLYNRRKLERLSTDALIQKSQSGRFSAIMVDIDDFKVVNDTYGHSCGDEVLKDIAVIIRGVSEGSGIAFRYGGEEMLILTYTGEDEAYSMAEDIRKKVENHSTFYEDYSVKVTLTLGVTEYKDSDSIETLIKRADANLYYGKNHGKNCVIK